MSKNNYPPAPAGKEFIGLEHDPEAYENQLFKLKPSAPRIWFTLEEIHAYLDLDRQQRVPNYNPSSMQVSAITTAYEQGVGKGHQAHERKTEIENPYAKSLGCREAWSLGYAEGKEQAAKQAAKAQSQYDALRLAEGTLRCLGGLASTDVSAFAWKTADADNALEIIRRAIAAGPVLEVCSEPDADASYGEYVAQADGLPNTPATPQGEPERKPCEVCGGNGFVSGKMPGVHYECKACAVTSQPERKPMSKGQRSKAYGSIPTEKQRYEPESFMLGIATAETFHNIKESAP